MVEEQGKAGERGEGDLADIAARINVRGDVKGTVTGVYIDKYYAGALVESKWAPMQLPGRPEVLEGRDELIEQVLGEMAPGRVVTLVGPGGVGKSALAAEVIWRLCDGKNEPSETYPDGLVWHSFYSQPEASAAMTAIAMAFGVDVKQAGGPEMAAKGALSGKTALLVLDATEVCDRLDEILALRGSCTILITTRKLAQSSQYSFEVPVLEEVDGVKVLKAWGREWADDEIALKWVVALVGGLALALELAGKFMGNNAMRAGEYLEWLEETPLQALDYGDREQESVEVLLEHNIAILSDSARAALGIFGLLGLDAVSTDALAFGMDMKKGPALRALGELRGFGMARRTEDKWTVGHALVHTYAGRRVGAPVEALGRLADLFARIATEANNKGFPAAFEGLRSHVSELAVRAESAGLEDAGALWNNLGYHLDMIGDYPGARKRFHQALVIFETHHGENHPKVAMLVNNLGNVMQAEGDLDGAKQMFDRALRIDETAFGPDHPDVARDVNNLGIVLKDQGDLAGARKMYERALHIFEKHFGENHPNVATSVNNLGTLMKDQDDLEGAQALYERALRIDEATYGSEHPSVARDVNNLGSVLQKQGDLARAQTMYERALKIIEATLGDKHTYFISSLNNLGGVLRRQGYLAEAQEMYGRALGIDEATYGKEHPRVAIRLQNLGGVLEEREDLDGARKMYERALRIFEKILPEGHASIETVRENLEAVERAIEEEERGRGESGE